MPRTLSGSDRITLKGIGDLLPPNPGCRICGSGTCEKGYIDIGVNLDFEGNLYFCVTCISECAEVAGLLSLEESDYLTRLNKDMAEELASLKLKVAEYNERLESYDRVISDLNTRHTDSSRINVSGPSAFAKQPESQPIPASVISGGTTDESIVTESSKSVGYSDPTRSERSDLNL